MSKRKASPNFEHVSLDGLQQMASRAREYIKNTVLQADELVNRKWREVRDAEKKIEHKLNTLEELWTRIKQEEKRLRLEKEEWLKERTKVQEQLAGVRRALEERKTELEEEQLKLQNTGNHLGEKKNEIDRKEKELVDREKQLKKEAAVLKGELRRTIQELAAAKEKHENEREQAYHQQQELQAENAKHKERIRNLEEACEQGNERAKRLRQEKDELSKRVNLLETELSEAEGLNPSPPPIERGGVRVVLNDDKPKERTSTRFDSPNPEPICLKRGRQWIVAVAIFEELPTREPVELYQNGSLLQQIENENGLWYLDSATEDIEVRRGEQSRKIRLARQPYLVFRLIGEYAGYGRLVKSPSNGSYLLVVPQNWQRDEDISGPAHVSPEPTTLTGFQAHYFILEEGDKSRIAFLSEEGEKVLIREKKPEFRLKGVRIDDAEEKMGPLFGREVPKITARNQQVWPQVGSVIVGEEGLGRGKWRTQFRTTIDKEEQELPAELKSRGSGWYFVRIYDHSDELIESLDFRYVRSLRALDIKQDTPVPSTYKYEPATVELIHDGNLTVQPDSIEKNSSVSFRDDKSKVVIQIPAKPEYDNTRWLVSGENGRHVPIALLIPRIWWALGEEGTVPSHWSINLLQVSREDFCAASEKALWIRFPARRWIKNVLAGFDYSKAKKYRVKVSEQSLAIPFRDFCDTEQTRRAGVSSLNLWFKHKGKEYEAVPINVEVHIKCKHCNFVTEDEDRFWSHLGCRHTNQFFYPLSYKEMQDHIPDLPAEIYKCEHCSAYVPSDDSVNPTSSIYDHLIKHHSRKSHSFAVISDLQEIRKNVLRDLPIIHKCTICDSTLKHPSRTSKMRHLKSIHRKSLCEIQ